MKDSYVKIKIYKSVHFWEPNLLERKEMYNVPTDCA